MSIKVLGIILILGIGLYILGFLTGKSIPAYANSDNKTTEVCQCLNNVGLTSPGSNLSDNYTMSLYEAEQFLAEVIWNHQYYIDHPELQSFATGDTAWQNKYVKQYERLRHLIQELAK